MELALSKLWCEHVMHAGSLGVFHNGASSLKTGVSTSCMLGHWEHFIKELALSKLWCEHVMYVGSLGAFHKEASTLKTVV